MQFTLKNAAGWFRTRLDQDAYSYTDNLYLSLINNRRSCFMTKDSSIVPSPPNNMHFVIPLGSISLTTVSLLPQM